MAPQEPAAENARTVTSSTSHINCLPTEIFPIIFFEAVQDSPAKCAIILDISRVCQLWRNIALSTSDLWTWIDTPDLGTIRTFMGRAQHRPLSVTLKEIKPKHYSAVRRISEALHNIRSFYLSIHYNRSAPIAGPFQEMASPAPALESLHLIGVHLPNNPFSGSLPSLRHLTLSRSNLKWSEIPECPQLRSICISEPDEYTPVCKFLERLPMFSLLEKIEANASLTEGSPAVSLTGRIDLPNLRSLIFDIEDAINVVAILDRISIPSTCQVVMVVNHEAPDEYLTMLPAVSNCRVGSPPDITKVKIVIVLTVKISIYQGDPKAKRVFDEDGFLEDLYYVFWPSPPRENPHHSIHAASQICLNQLNLVHLDTIDLSALKAVDHPTPLFWEFLDSLTSLRVLKVRHIYAESFINFLSTTSHSPDRDLPPFSAIRKLVYEDPNKDVNECITRLTELARYLGMRAEKGFGLTSLTLVHFRRVDPIPPDVLETLGTLVTERVKRKLRRWRNSGAVLVL